jgi:hypothetical protein
MKGRVSISIPVVGHFQILIRHLIFASDVRWFKIFIGYDSLSVMVSSRSGEGVFGLVAACTLLATSDIFHKTVPKWQHSSDPQLLTMRSETT